MMISGRKQWVEKGGEGGGRESYAPFCDVQPIMFAGERRCPSPFGGYGAVVFDGGWFRAPVYSYDGGGGSLLSRRKRWARRLLAHAQHGAARRSGSGDGAAAAATAAVAVAVSAHVCLTDFFCVLSLCGERYHSSEWAVGWVGSVGGGRGVSGRQRDLRRLAWSASDLM